jgi:hypothetical protein
MADFAKVVKQIESWEERGAWMIVRHPYTNEPLGDDLPARIHFSSPLSKRWQEMEKTWQVERIVSKQGQAAQIAEGDIERFERHRMKCFMAVTREWENIEREGVSLACTPVNMEWLYSLPFVFNQVFNFLNDLTNFGAPADIENNHHLAPDVLEDIEKKLSTGATGSLQ